MRINVPSWCDRILWKSHPETHLVCNSYGERDGDGAGAEPGAARAARGSGTVPRCPRPSPGCTDDIVTSDHSPVFATFEVGVTSQFVPKSGKDEGTGSVPAGTWGPAPHPLSPPAPPAAPGSSPEPLARIEWESIEVIVKTASRSKCYIEFHSYCLEGEVAPRGGSLGWARSAAGTGLELCPPFPGSVPAEAQRSGENNSQSCDVPGFLRMGWSAKQLPVVRPAPCRAPEHPPASSPHPSPPAVPAPCTR